MEQFLKKCFPNEVQNVCMTSLCFHDRIFSSKFGGNISLVGMSWQSKCIGRYKNIALKMSLSPGNKSGDSFNFYLQKSIAQWEPSLKEAIRHEKKRQQYLIYGKGKKYWEDVTKRMLLLEKTIFDVENTTSHGQSKQLFFTV